MNETGKEGLEIVPLLNLIVIILKVLLCCLQIMFSQLVVLVVSAFGSW